MQSFTARVSLPTNSDWEEDAGVLLNSVSVPYSKKTYKYARNSLASADYKKTSTTAAKLIEE